MRAALYYGKEDIRIEDVPEPSPSHHQIKIRPSHVGICGTDLHEYLGGPTFAPTTPHPLTKDTLPIVLGHEFSGTIVELGSAVDPSRFAPGQHVAVQPSLYCGACLACESGAENACPKGGFVGLSGGGGGLSSAVVVGVEAVHVLPDSVPLDVGALVEPLSVGWHAVDAAGDRIETGSVVLVLGGGPIGLAVLQCLKAKAVSNVIVAEVAERRKEFALQFGADHVVDPTAGDALDEIKRLSNGGGPDVVFDCAGVPASIKLACKAVKVRGCVVNVAIWEKEVPFQPNDLTFKEAWYTAVLGYQRKDFEAVIARIADGSLQPRNMVTGMIQLEDLVEKGFRPLIERKAENVKILVEMVTS